MRKGGPEEKPRVLVTAGFEGKSGTGDFVLPADTPVSEWLPGLAATLGWPAPDPAAHSHGYTLRARDPLCGEVTVVRYNQTLEQAGVCDGYELWASLRPPSEAELAGEVEGTEFDVNRWQERVVDQQVPAMSLKGRRSRLRPVAFERGPRQLGKPPEEVVELYQPEPRPAEPAGSLWSVLLPPLVTVAVMGAIVGVMVVTGSTAMVTTLIFSVPMMLAAALAGILRLPLEKRSYRRKLQKREAQYRAMLEDKRGYLAALQAQTRRTLLQNDPDPEGCLELVEQHDPRRLWARTPSSEDFLSVRLGIGARPFQVQIKTPQQQTPMNPDPLVEQAKALADEFKEVFDVPIRLSLPQERVVGLAGARESLHHAFRSLAMQVAAHHLPTEVKIVALLPANEIEQWGWIRWLPHVWSDDGGERYLAWTRETAKDLLQNLQKVLQWRQQKEQRKGSAPREVPAYVVFIVDQALVKGQEILPKLKLDGPALGFYPIFASEEVGALPEECRAVVELDGSQAAGYIGPTRQPVVLAPDTVSLELVDQFSRSMAPIRVKADTKEAAIPPVVTLLEALGVERVEDLDLLRRWRESDPTRSLAVPLGKRTGGEIQNLDLHEPQPEPTTQSGHGPHALVAGQSGYGKSELLQSLIVSLAVNFHPHELVIVIGDFKPPGVSPILFGLPHVVNVIHSNQLADVPRALQSLESELARRSRLFTQAGVSHIDAYMKLHRSGDSRAAEPLPYLVLIVDEFQALRNELPQALEKFIKVAAQGRAYGFRMILATQSLAMAVPPSILANTALRLCLSTANAAESQNVLDRPDAAGLTRKGRTFLRVGQDLVFEQFQCAWGGAEYAPQPVDSGAPEVYEVLLHGRRRRLRASSGEQGQAHCTQLEAVVSYIRSVAEQAGIHSLLGPWREPLPEHLALYAVRPQRGWDGRTWQPPGRWLCPTIGLQDDPAHQEQPPLEPDLGRKGHLLVCTGPGVDSRLPLRTLITSLVLDHSPRELNLYCLDFGSLGLRVFDQLPHCGGVIIRDEADRLANLFHFLDQALAQRKLWREQHRLGSIAEGHRKGSADEAPPALVLVVDNLAAIGDDLEMVDRLAQLVREGPQEGIHFILAGDQTALKYSAVLRNVALTLALQLGDMTAYRALPGNWPSNLPKPPDVPGRGLFSGEPPLECQVAWPLSSQPGEAEEAEIQPLVAAMRQAWHAVGGRKVRRIDALPKEISLRELLAEYSLVHPSEAAHLAVPLGLDYLTREPLELDLVADGPHFLIAGPGGSGKTTTLVTWVMGLAERFSADMVRFYLFDSIRRSLAILRDLPHIDGYAVTESEQMALVEQLEARLAERRTTGAHTARPALVVVCDDYERVKSQRVKESLRDRARDDDVLGLHVILAGASPGMLSTFADPLRKQVVTSGSGILVGSHDLVGDTQLWNLTPPSGAKTTMLPGRAYLLRKGQFRLMQVATAGDEGAVCEWVRQIRAREQVEVRR